MTDEAKALVRPIIGIEYRTPQEVFDIMCDRFAYRNALIETQARENAAKDAEIERLRRVFAEALEQREGSRREIERLRIALHEIDIEASNTIPADGKDAAFAALFRIAQIINPFRPAKAGDKRDLANHG